ncbi:unnamed protein product [Cladocopium goreaui]|uniref:Uncharacterized protein n=1 Tax=Cladocopium goreaui TaxID=2562237 RepID=A0A9P1CKV0_9DINO|nr:unnamed protein product [Cladocopium goreaui]
MVFKSWTEQNLDVCEFEALMVPTNHSLPRQNRCAFRATEAESGELPPADEKKESQVSETPQVQAGPAPGPTPAPANSGTSGAPKAAPRRRREGERQRRSQQNLLVQLFKPPSTGRGRLLMSLNLLIVCVLVSFCVVLMDVIRNPPTLLNPPPDPKAKEQKP